MTTTILTGDALEQLRTLDSESVHCCVTSPPYYGLRDYGTAEWRGGDPGCDHLDHSFGKSRGEGKFFDGGKPRELNGARPQCGKTCSKCGATRKDGQIGLEATPEAHIAALVEVFREVRRVLRPDGVCFVNYGDAMAGSWGAQSRKETPATISRNSINNHPKRASHTGTIRSDGLKPKDLMMLPARVALALQADGWWLRSQMPWVKRSAMPESATDRPATAIEYVFMLTKSGDATFWQHRDGGATNKRPEPDYRWINKLTGAERCEPREGDEWKRVNLWRGRDYFWDMEAVRRPHARLWDPKTNGGSWAHPEQQPKGSKAGHHSGEYPAPNPNGRNYRNSDPFFASLEKPHGLIYAADGTPLALDVNPKGWAESHFATFPPKLIEPLIKAATSERGCCPDCGAPWVREVERATENRSGSGKSGNEINGKGHPSSQVRDDHDIRNGPTSITKTLGWSPSCSHGLEPVSCTILDPFLGAGTTSLVADRLGRDSIGIELNPEYAAMARRRIDTDGATRGTGPAEVMRGDDLPLFA